MAVEAPPRPQTETVTPKDLGLGPPETEYWLTMQYRCGDDPELIEKFKNRKTPDQSGLPKLEEGCGFEIVFYLEVGCEGPKDRNEGDVVMTDGGRLIVPVPLYAGPCPNCNSDGSNRGVSAGWLSHTRWNQDAQLWPRLRESELPEKTDDGRAVGRFVYPADQAGRDPQACGVPTYDRDRDRDQP